MTSEAPGWDAIDAALERLHPGVEPRHFGTMIKWRHGGSDPLDGISYYLREDPIPHWHIVSYGMSELYTKDSQNAEESGWGFEFTFRLRREPGDTEPPLWATTLLQNLARYVFETGNWFAVNHHMDLNGPIQAGRTTLIRAIAFIEDPELGSIETASGHLQFLQVVGITWEEYAATQTWSVRAVLDLAAQQLPLLITDLDRPTLTDDPTFAAAVEAGRRLDGSSTGSLSVSGFSWIEEDDITRLVVGADVAERVAQTLRGRLPFGRQLSVGGPDGTVLFSSGSFAVGTGSAPDLLEVVLTREALDGLLGALVPVAGLRTVPGAPGLIVEITRLEIDDSQGNGMQTID